MTTFNACPPSLRFAEELDDVADGLGGEELGVAALVAGLESGNQGWTTAYPAVQAVECHMRVAVGKIQQRQLTLGVTFDGKCRIHKTMVDDA